MQPRNAIMKRAINIESLPNITDPVNLDNISLIRPNAGKIKMYTSGWPKNQNKCWKYTMSPPLIGSRKDELKCLSKIIMVMQPANTGKDITNNIDVKKIDQLNSDRNRILYCIARLDALNIVTMKLMDPNNELNPAACNEKNRRSIEQ